MRRPADPGLFHTAPGQACHRSLCHYGLSESRSLHTGLTLPVYTPVFDWRAHLDLEDLGRVRQQDYAYVSWGWGDRQFYVNTPRFQDLQLTTALRALFWPTDTAMEVRAIALHPVRAMATRSKP
ncbi:MAG: DUF2459 domain-containing protein [Synechococcales cyanobacterium RU_4_20]|nr:DUF2459 domain-containing protein [Synechococcales cyanobacterium RU_4_20]